MVNMNNRGIEVIIVENEIDKISNLPMDILDEIFKDMSFQELVKTCVLSKKWEHFWTMHPILVLDWEFFEEKSGTIGLIENGFSNMIDNILLQHVGSLVKFFRDLSTIDSHRIQFLTVHDSYDIHISFFDNLSNVKELFMVVNTFSAGNIDEIIYYLEDPNCVDKQFEKLEFVELREFEVTQFELLFLKLILAYSPSLSRMIVEPSDEVDVAEVLSLYEELRMSLKASPIAKVIVAPHGQDV
ncbi:F-box/LRR-repeat protein 25-like [Solanum stenotomum]|uniref:F-box/LRR-repeat protein 25-like n=1 Tax=Solanum stenotomum TaxID=172797 RepID=UPI0020D08B70|nr:F-box/LRR-repeat protein 25-like [Solanum stenotomum]